MATCDRVRGSYPVKGIEVTISRRSSEAIDFSAGPRCRFSLTVEGGVAKLPSETAACPVAVRQTSADATFSSFRLISADFGLTQSGSGRATLAVPNHEPLSCEEFELSGSLVRSDTP